MLDYDDGQHKLFGHFLLCVCGICHREQKQPKNKKQIKLMSTHIVCLFQ